MSAVRDRYVEAGDSGSTRCALSMRGNQNGREWRDEYARARSEEHTSELQSQSNLVCRLLLEKQELVIVSKAATELVPKTSHQLLIVIELFRAASDTSQQASRFVQAAEKAVDHLSPSC